MSLSESPSDSDDSDDDEEESDEEGEEEGEGDEVGYDDGMESRNPPRERRRVLAWVFLEVGESGVRRDGSAGGRESVGSWRDNFGRC